jgi:OFA family oxalate/formate antiporter-like MFS transporter
MTVAENPTRGRWLLAAAGVLLQCALGGVYAWSVFSKALQSPESTFALDQARAALPFSVTIGMIFIGTFVGGRIQDAKGPRIVAVAGGIVYSAGILLAGLADGRERYWLLITGYGVIAGFGLGLAYIVPVTMLQKWFPDKRGLITGIAVGGLGFGAVLASPVAGWLVSRYAEVPTRAFLWLGIGYLVMTLTGASRFRNPPKDYRVPGWRPPDAGPVVTTGRDYRPGEALRTRQWYMLTAILALNVTAGIGLISVAANAAHEVAGYSLAAAATFTGVMGLFNGGGRIFWGWLSERIGRMAVFLVMFLLQGTCFFVLPHATAPALFAALAAVIYLCFGGGFGTMPATAADYFGLRHAGAIYGLMIAGWSIGGVVGPLLVANLIDGESYATAFTVIAVIAFGSVLLPLVTRPPRVHRAAAESRQPVPMSGSAGSATTEATVSPGPAGNAGMVGSAKRDR